MQVREGCAPGMLDLECRFNVDRIDRGTDRDFAQVNNSLSRDFFGQLCVKTWA